MALQSQVNSIPVSSTAYAGIELLGRSTEGSTNLTAEFTVINDAIAAAIGSTSVSRAILSGSAPANNLAAAVVNLENAVGTITEGLLGSNTITIANAIGSTSVSRAILSGSAPANNLASAIVNLENAVGNDAISGGSISAAIKDLQTEVGDTTNLLGVNSSITQAIGSNNISNIGDGTLSGAIGNNSILNHPDSLSAGIDDISRDIGDIGTDHGYGSLYSITYPVPSGIAHVIGAFISRSQNNQDSYKIASNILNTINSYSSEIDISTLEDDINNSIITSGYPATTAEIGSILSANLMALSNSATSTEVAAAIYSSGSYESGKGPIKDPGGHSSDLAHNIMYSPPSLVKAIGTNSISTLADGTITGAIKEINADGWVTSARVKTNTIIDDNLGLITWKDVSSSYEGSCNVSTINFSGYSSGGHVTQQNQAYVIGSCSVCSANIQAVQDCINTFLDFH